MKPGDKVIRPGKPDEVFTVEPDGFFAVRHYGPPGFNHVDKKWYLNCEILDLALAKVEFVTP
jgi:hypothetical protein